MQVSATLIAAQAAAREARARLQMPQQTQAAPFAAALEKTSATEKTDGFSSLPLKQTAVAAPSPTAQPTQTAAPARVGQHIDITV